MALKRKENNLDIMRLVAAWMVLFGHCFTLYDDSQDILQQYLDYSSLTSIALNIFFTISGYLITASYLSKQNVKIFMINRILRIIPALIVVILLSIFVLGPIVTELTAGEYFSHKDTYKYLRGILLFPLRYNLPGVFENNPYPTAVNGSLWSLEVEMKCYIMIAILGVLALLKKKILLPLAIACFASYCALEIFSDGAPKRLWIFKYSNLLNGTQWFSPFLFGGCLYMFKDRVKYSSKIFLAVLILDLLLWYLVPYGKYMHIPLLSYMIIYVGLHTKPIASFLKGNDVSYGLYIYAFPIQQCYMYYIGVTYGFTSFVIVTTIFSLLFGYLSWKLIEKPTLNLKRKTN